MAKQLEFEFWRTAPIISLMEYRRGRLAAHALWMACFNPGEQPERSPNDEAFALGWAHYVKEQKYGK